MAKSAANSAGEDDNRSESDDCNDDADRQLYGDDEDDGDDNRSGQLSLLVWRLDAVDFVMIIVEYLLQWRDLDFFNWGGVS